MHQHKKFSSFLKIFLPLLIFLAFSVAFSYTQITPYLIKVSKIIDVDNPDYFIDLSAPDVSIKTAGNIHSSGNLTVEKYLCVGEDCVNSISELSGIPSGYCVVFYNESCPSSFIFEENLTEHNQFNYKRPITITEQSGQDLTDYQVQITLDTQSLISAGKMRSDCGDIRFYDENNNELPYWIEDGTCNSANTKIWVKVSYIPASSSTTIYLYYGNPSIASLSSIENTFLSHFKNLSLAIFFENEVKDETKQHTVTLHNSIEYVDGIHGKAGNFSNNAWITTDKEFTSSMTICANFKLSILKNWQQLWGSEAGPDYGECWVYETGGIKCRGEATLNGITTDTWYSFCFPYNTSYSDNNDSYVLKGGSFNGIYTPGESDDSYLPPAIGYNIYFDADTQDGDVLFEGSMDDILVFDRRLEDSELLELTDYMRFENVSFIAGNDTLAVRKYTSPEPIVTLDEEKKNQNLIVCCKQ